MEFVMKTSKTVLTIVALSIATSMLITTASAEEIIFNKPPAADIPVAVTVTAAPPAVLEKPQNSPPAADSTYPQSGGTVTNETAPAAAQASDSAPAPTDAGIAHEAEQDPPQLVQETASAENLMLTAGQAIAEFTKQFDGFRYVYGAESPKYGFDCSGLVWYVYTHFGYTLPRTAGRQYKDGVSVEQPELQPGDLVFFDTNGGSRSISHVGIYVGDGQFIHASTSRHGVMISRLDNTYWAKAYYGAKRIITPQSALRLFSEISSASIV